MEKIKTTVETLYDIMVELCDKIMKILTELESKLHTHPMDEYILTKILLVIFVVVVVYDMYKTNGSLLVKY